MTRLNTSPNNWEGLKKLKEFLSDCEGKYLRLPEYEQYYTLYKKYVPRQIVLKILRKQIRGRSICLMANNFPYSKTLKNLPYVKHLLLWSLNGKLNNDQIKQYVSKRLKGKNWFLMERKTHFKSIPEIWHCHIFVNDKKG